MAEPRLLTPEELIELITSTGGTKRKLSVETPHHEAENKKAKAKRKQEKRSRRINRRK